MDQPWERLVEGPRGRQLCALLAVDAERRGLDADVSALSTPLSHALFFTEVGRPGTTLFGASRGGEPIEFHATEPSQLRDALAGVRVDAPEPDVLPDLLDQVANDAWYWQPPARRDALLADASMVELLRPWAAALGTLDHTAWWHGPMDSDHQWCLHPPGPNDDVPGDRPVAVRLAEWRRDERAADARVRSEPEPAPGVHVSASWWSHPMGVPASTRRWPAGRPDPENPAAARWRDPIEVRVQEDRCWEPDELSWQRLEVPAGARVVEIDGADAWAALCREYPLDVSASRRTGWRHCTGRDGDWVIPDWAEVARDVDAVHLPMAAWLELAGRALPVDEHRASVIAGWSPDMTVWMVDPPLVGPIVAAPHAG